MSGHLQCAQCPVRDSAACSALTPAQRDTLAQIGRHQHYAPGETIFAAGEDNDRIATLNSGLLKITETDAEGTERIVGLIHPAGFVGELFAPSIRFAINALSESTLCVFSRQRYEAALADLPNLSLALLRRTIADTSDAKAMVGLIGRHTAKQRLAGLLLNLADSAGSMPCRAATQFDLQLGREDIGALLGLRIETVSRAFKALEEDGLVRRDGRRGIIINDQDRLRAMVE
jgi:CRP/FNR family transcriptional regulator